MLRERHGLYPRAMVQQTVDDQKQECVRSVQSRFVPEPLHKAPGLVPEANALVGPYYCIGKNLALSELRFVTALLASKYNITFPAGENGDSCVEDMVDQFTAAPGQLDLVFSKRKNDCF